MTVKELLKDCTKNDFNFIFSQISEAREAGFDINIDVFIEKFKAGTLDYNPEVEYEYIIRDDWLKDIYYSLPDSVIDSKTGETTNFSHRLYKKEK